MKLLYILIAILIFGVIVIFHEFGHYIVGRLTGMTVLEFSIGFGPKLFGKEKNGTLYSLRVIPFGGFCKFLGEDGDSDDPKSMNKQAVWRRFLTVAAGVTMNFLLAFIAAIILICMNSVADVFPVVDSVVENTPAMTAGLQNGDIILSANGTALENNANGVNVVKEIIQSSDTIELTVERNGETVAIELVPELVDDDETGTQRKQIGIYFRYRKCNFFEALPLAGEYMVELTKLMYESLGELVRGKNLDQVSGPVGTISVVSDVVQSDLTMIPYIICIISLNLGIINLLPIPGLDGAHLVFLIIEAIRRKPVPPEKENLVHAIGLILLFLLMIAITFKDVFQYIIK